MSPETKKAFDDIETEFQLTIEQERAEHERAMAKVTQRVGRIERRLDEVMELYNDMRYKLKEFEDLHRDDGK